MRRLDHRVIEQKEPAADKVANGRAAHKPREETQCGAEHAPLWRSLRSSAPHPRKTKTRKEPRNADKDHRFHHPHPTPNLGKGQEVAR